MPIRALAPRSDPRALLRVDLGRLAPRRRARPGDSGVELRERTASPLGRLGGPAAALELALERARAGRPPPFAVAVGDCVARGEPTAARAWVGGVGALAGRWCEGSVGSDLGARLARACSALAIEGAAAHEHAVLVLGLDASGGPTLELQSWPELDGASPARAASIAERRLGPCAFLRVGPAAAARRDRRPVAFASLAAGGEHPSFTGRGGLGASFAARGLAGLAVTAEPIRPRGSPALRHLLASSPRLATRAAQGTFELAHALAARGELRARNQSEGVDAASGAHWSSELARRAARAEGCRGCPTPCGWTFELPRAAAGGAAAGEQRARFGAAWSVGRNLGIADAGEALRLLALCDELGLDAKEAGAALALACRARELGRWSGAARWDDADGCAQTLRECVRGIGPGAALQDGAAVFARSFGLEREHAAARGQAARADRSLASVLGQCVSSAGADPMRAFPFSVAGGGAAERAALERLMAPLALPSGAEDPFDPAGKGLIVWWHESLMAALDLGGFCAFSAGALLADGELSLDELARWILPTALGDAALDAERAEAAGATGATGSWRELAPGARALAAGAAVVLARRAIDAALGAPADADEPEWARARLALPGMLDAYRAARGLDGAGRLTTEAMEALESIEAPAALGAPRLARPLAAVDGRAPARTLAAARNASGEPSESGELCAARTASTVAHVELRAQGPLAVALGDAARLECELPATLAAVLEAAAQRAPAARALVFAGERFLPAAWRAGELLGPGSEVRAGDRIDLVLAVAGG